MDEQNIKSGVFLKIYKMKRLIKIGLTCLIALVFILPSTSGISQELYTIKAHYNYGGNKTDEVTKVIKTNDDKVIFIGSTNSDSGDYIDNKGGRDVYIRKINPENGNTIWLKMIGGSKDDWPVDIIEDINGDLIILCNTFSKDGDFLFVDDEETTYSEFGIGHKIFRLDADGEILSSEGHFRTPDMFCFPKKTAMFQKADGTVGTIGNHYYPDFSCTHSIAGFKDVVSFGIIEGYTGISQFKEISNGDYIGIGYLSGFTPDYNVPYGADSSRPGEGAHADILLFRRDGNNGEVIWKTFIGGTKTDFGIDFQERDGYLYIIGISQSWDNDLSANNGTDVIYLAKIDISDGSIIKSIIYGTAGRDYANKILVRNNGNILVGGFIRGANPVILEYDEDLNLVEKFEGQDHMNYGRAVRDIIETDSAIYFVSETSLQDSPDMLAYNPDFTTGSDVFFAKLAEVDPIIIYPFYQKEYCNGSQLTVSIKTRFPTGTVYSYRLFNEESEILSLESASTTTSFQLTNLPSGNYHVKVSANGFTGEDSNTITFYSLSDISFIDEINQELTTADLCPGSTKNIRAIPKNSLGDTIENPEFKWYKGYLLPDESDSIIVSSSGYYSVSVKEGICSISREFRINAADIPKPSITSEGDYACEGESVLLKATRYHTLETSFQWFQDGTPIIGATGNSYIANNPGDYSFQISDSNCSNSINSSPTKEISFTTALFANIYFNYNDSTTCNGSPVEIIAEFTKNSLSPHTFRWQKDGVDIEGGTNSSLFTNEAGKYRVKISQGSCETYSKELTVVASNTFQKPNIFSTYDSICFGRVELISGTNIGDEYVFEKPGEWHKDGGSLGSTSNSLITYNGAGKYKLIRGVGTSCEIASDEKEVFYGVGFKPKIQTIDYKHSNNLCGDSLTQVHLGFNSKGLTGFPLPLQYQWKKNGDTIPGATTPNLYVSEPGVYQLEASNAWCPGISEPIVITKSNTSKPKISVSDSNPYCSNRLITLEAVEIQAGGFYETGYNWYKDGVWIPNENRDKIIVSEGGNYHMSFDLYGCSGISDTVSIETGPPSDFDPVLQTGVETGNSANLNVASCPGEVKWYNKASGGTLLHTGSSFGTPHLSEDTSYWVTCTVEYCESSRVKVNVIITDCESDINHTVKVAGRLYLTNKTITSEIDVKTGTIYQAGKAIILEPGFSAGSNEVFEARIGGCE